MSACEDARWIVGAGIGAGAQRLVHEVEAHEALGDKEPQRFHLLGELHEDHLLGHRQLPEADRVGRRLAAADGPRRLIHLDNDPNRDVRDPTVSYADEDAAFLINCALVVVLVPTLLERASV